MPPAAPRLPLREGVSASTLVLPQLATLAFVPSSLLSFLEHPAHNPQGISWENRLKQGLVCDAQGHSLATDAAYAPGQRVFYWRDAGPEQRIPFDEQIVYQDQHILVADKPHFLPVTPTGRYVHETLLVRLKKRTGLAALTPMHRIDRDTAGLVMFCIRSQDRNAYAQMFRERRVSKGYECVAPYSESLSLPLTRKSRLEASPDSFMQMREVPGQPNSETHIELIEHTDTLARYALRPITGKRHQLRLHMNALGLPILGDGIYPVLTAQPKHPQYDAPLQLLAKDLVFDDPLSGKRHAFSSNQRLASALTMSEGSFPTN